MRETGFPKWNEFTPEAAAALLPRLMAEAGLAVELFPTDDPDDMRGVNSSDDIAVCEAIIQKRRTEN